MSKWIKINDRNFTVIDISLQYTIGLTTPVLTDVSSCDIILSLNTPIGSTDYNYIMDIYDNSYKSYKSSSDYKFEIISGEFKCNGCIIKSIEYDPSKNILTLGIISDYVQVKDISDRRNDIIDQFLNKTNQ